jgi:hypothetical protein
MKRRGRPALSPWIDGSVKPVRIGVYQRRLMSGVVYARWDGERWRQFSESRRLAERTTGISGEQAYWSWRGRAQP